MLTEDTDTAQVDRWLDAPLPRELSAEDRRLASARRAADLNRAAVAQMGRG